MEFRIVHVFQQYKDPEPINKYLYAGSGEDMTYICEIKDESLISEDIVHNAKYLNAFIKEEIQEHEKKQN